MEIDDQEVRQYWFHVHLRRQGLIEQSVSLNVPGQDSFNPLIAAVVYGDTTIEQHMDDIIGSGPPNPFEANEHCRLVVIEANRLGLVQHAGKLKPPVQTEKDPISQRRIKNSSSSL